MKLRIDGQQIHFRIDKSELTRLCLGASLNQCIHFPNGRGLTVSVLTGRSTSPMQLIFDNDVMQLLVDRGSAYDLLKALPRKEGIATHQPFNSDQRMEIILDVDLRFQNYPGKDHEWA